MKGENQLCADSNLLLPSLPPSLLLSLSTFSSLLSNCSIQAKVRDLLGFPETTLHRQWRDIERLYLESTFHTVRGPCIIAIHFVKNVFFSLLKFKVQLIDQSQSSILGIYMNMYLIMFHLVNMYICLHVMGGRM